MDNDEALKIGDLEKNSEVIGFLVLFVAAFWAALLVATLVWSA